jgi:protein-L-isoaspartate(D-aspartate) O-methyltransferase
VSQDPPRAHRFPLRLDELDARSNKSARTAAQVNTAKAGSTTQLLHTPLPRPPPPAEKPPALRSSHETRAAAPVRSTVSTASSGLGLDSAGVRLRMAQRLRGAGVSNKTVLDAMATVPRHLFVDAALVTQAYEDTSLPIGHGQTISKPSVVARMIELLLNGAAARKSATLGRTLEIGTGCGYQAAVLALLSKQVISVERLRPLHDKARTLLEPLRSANLRLVYADGSHGHPPNAPYESIIAAASGSEIPPAWLDQLAVGGRLVCPMQQENSTQQALMVVDRTEHGYERNTFEAVYFVPLKSGQIE